MREKKEGIMEKINGLEGQFKSKAEEKVFIFFI